MFKLHYFTFFALAFSSCFNKPQPQTQQSEVDAITAVSEKWFGKNVRGYMWALTVSDSSTYAQGIPTGTPSVPTKSSGTTSSKNTSPKNAVNTGGVLIPPPQNLMLAELEEANTKHFQCWYYAETKNKVKLDKQDLPKLFLSKETKKINKNFINLEYIITDLQDDENFRRMLTFTVQTLSNGFCGILPLIKQIKHGIFLTPVCSLALGAFSARINQFSKGDSSQGAAAAKTQIEAQVKAKADELSEINWEALMTIYKKLDSFNRIERTEQNTKIACPEPQEKLLQIMGLTDSKGNSSGVANLEPSN